jgi:DNA-binding MarR family transcriptional regulator
VYLVGRVDRGIRRRLEGSLEQFGLSLSEFTLMSILKRRPGLSNAQLARRSLITPQSMFDVIVRLEARDLVVRDLAPAHGRALSARLTPAGKRLIEKAERAAAVLEDDLLADLAEPERAQLRQALIGVVARLRDRAPESNVLD